MNRAAFIAITCTLALPTVADARLSCPKGTRPIAQREARGLVRACVLKRRKSGPKAAPERHGPATGYYASGRKRWTAVYANGTLNGPYRAYKRSGAKQSVGAYRLGKRHGDWTLWFRNSLDRGPYVDGEKHGHWVTELNEGGRIEGDYDHGRQHGQWRTFNAARRLVDTRFFELGRGTATWKGRYDDGSPRYEGTWVDGRKMGVWQRWHPGGKLAETRLYDAQGGGEVTQWHANGQLRLQGRYANGDRVGLWRSLFPSGRVRSETTYARDDVIGLKTWDRDGKPLLVRLPAAATPAVSVPERPSP